METAWPNTGQWFEVEITSWLAQWINGTLPNHGIQAYTTSTIRTGGMDIRSPGWPDPRYRPKLVVTYTRTSPAGRVVNATTGETYDLIQCAVNDANSGDTLVLQPGVYREVLDLDSKDLILQSIDPNNPSVVEETIIQGNQTDPVITFNKNNTVCKLQGLTITGGQPGLVLKDASPQIEHCRIIENVGHGIEMWVKSDPTICNTFICRNRNIGILMIGYMDIDVTIHNEPNLLNCTIAQNAQEGIKGGIVTMRNCIVHGNGTRQLSSVSAFVSYSCIQGGYPGDGNIDADPCFARLAYLDPNSTPDDPNDDFLVSGDYHLKSQAGRFDPNSAAWVQDDVTSPCIDTGDPSSDIGDEPVPNGGIINLGAYGGTIQASRSLGEELN